MQRYKKKDMLQMVNTLLCANDAIAGTVLSNPQGATEALAQCQESAIMLGSYIDTLGERYSNLVRILEDYCENIYLISENLSDKNICRKISKKIQKQLTGLNNSIKYDMPEDKKEVVFLPYKASMWDSLESVWKAAEDDPGCNAYVIPIPYFDKNPNGSFKEEHYEGNRYPSYVPVTRYDEYDLEARRPDIIYIHNPYDECNHVTSVHPYFYSKNLRNFTDQLVYIPYFILPEIEPDNQDTIDTMKHFCFTPGTIYAHQVIVQSEKMRQIYINEYIKAAKEMGLSGEHVDRKILEKKFLGTGSPKIDKILNTKKEDLEVPAEWLKIIEKPDGSWKKIVFYNTSVSALLEHSEKMIEKMRSVFAVFKENRQEIALLWRPHPLIQATIESMRPQLWEDYKELKDSYIEAGWGIYDDTPDVDRAITICDAYYRDHSSVVPLCEKSKKQVLIQNGSKGKEENCENIWLISRGSEFDDENDILWMVTVYTSILLKIDRKSGTLMKVYQIPIREIREYHYLDIKKAGSYLYLIPFNAEHVYRFHIETEQFDRIELPLSEQEKAKTGKFGQIFRVKDFLYIVGYNLPLVIKLDLNTLQMKRIEGFHTNGDSYARDGMLLEDDLYIPYYRKNIILHVNTENDSWEELALESQDFNGFGTITRTNDEFILTDLADHRISCGQNENRMAVNSLQLLSSDSAECAKALYYYQYQKVYYYQNKEYYFPVCKSQIWMRDGQSNKKELVYAYPYDSRMKIDYYSKFEMINRYKNDIYFQARTNGDIFVIDMNKDEIQKFTVHISGEVKRSLLCAIIKGKDWKLVHETDVYSLPLFVHHLLSAEREM